jgi:hypothetical protein
MSNTKTLAIVAILTAATLVIGVTFAATLTQSAFATTKGDPGKDKKAPDIVCTANNSDTSTIAFICQDVQAKQSGSGTLSQSATGTITIGGP